MQYIATLKPTDDTRIWRRRGDSLEMAEKLSVEYLTKHGQFGDEIEIVEVRPVVISTFVCISREQIDKRVPGS